MLHGLYQGIFNGLASGLIYILVALGLTLLFSIMGILNFAHGEIYMLGAYVVYYACVVAGINFFWSLLISALALGILGVLLERFMFRPIRGDMEPAVLACIGLTVLLQTLAVIAFGTYLKYIPSIFPGVLKLGGLRLSKDRLLVMAIALTFTLALILVVNKTKVGKALRATAVNREAASYMGIRTDRMNALAWAIGGGTAGVAGGLLVNFYYAFPTVGLLFVMIAFACVALGGFGSIKGVFFAGLLVGVIEILFPIFGSLVGSSFLGPHFKFTIVYLAYFIIVVFRPQGLFGWKH